MNDEFKPDGINIVEIKMISIDAVDLKGSQVHELSRFNPVFLNTQLNSVSSAIFHQDTISEMIKFTETYDYMVKNNILYMKVNLQ